RSDNFNFSSGFERGETRVTCGLEWERRLPIHGDQRSWFASPERSPDPQHRELDHGMSLWDRSAGGWGLLDISDRCDSQGYEAVRPGWAGPGAERYCGDNVFGTYTIRNGRDRIFGFANLSHTFGGHEFYATLMSAKSDADAG